MVISLFILINIIGKTKFPKEVTITQVPITKINDNLLLEKNPIVIPDFIVEINQVIKTIFSYLYVSKSNVQNKNEPKLEKNRFQYLLFWAKKQVDIIIQHPIKGYVMIKLYSGNILILPWAWKYQIKNNYNFIEMIGLHSIMTWTLALF